MIKEWLDRMFRKQAPSIPLPVGRQITAADVEARIEAAGRADVFVRAAELGWTPANPAPMWVWYQIAGEVLAAKGVDTPTVH